MTTSFFLRRQVIDPQKPLAIQESDYFQLQAARSTLVDAFSFEQKFDLLKENFVAFEIAATEWSLRATIEFNYSYGAISSVMQEASRHVMNLLTAARAYVDQVQQDFKHLALSPSFGEQAKQKLSEQYDSSVDYRLMEALRNYVQHCGQSVHSFSGNIAGKRADWAHAVSLRTLKAQLSEDKSFKPEVLAEMPAYVDVRVASRAYVHALSIVHLALRQVIEREVDSARGAVQLWTQRYLENGNDSAVGLYAHKSAAGADDPLPVLLLLDWDDVRLSLVNKNGAPVLLERRVGAGA
jgi:hypothetical protein